LEQAAALAAARAGGHAPPPARGDEGHDTINWIVGGRTDSGGSLERMVHWAKLNGEEYAKDTCTWEDASATTETELAPDFLVGSDVTVSTKKRSNNGQITEYDPAKKRYKITFNGAKKDQWLNLNKPLKNQSWELRDFAELGELSDDSDESDENQL
jgi:hypothetical protein